MGFVNFEGLLKDKKKFDSFVESAGKTMQKLEELAAKGTSPQEKAEARKALKAFDHAIALLQAGFELTQKNIKEMQAQAKAKAEGKKK